MPTAKKSAAKGSSSFTAEERAAMKERAKEIRSTRRKPADGEQEVLAKIAAMQDPDRAIGGQLHALIQSVAPSLQAQTWYGMPAYAEDGNVVCFFQDSGKFKTRYATLGFSDKAQLDDGAMWPTAYAIQRISAVEEKKIRSLLERAIGSPCH
jgi:uncharacterized protein YdhG (YjbR/CyaY superfamily)